MFGELSLSNHLQHKEGNLLVVMRKGRAIRVEGWPGPFYYPECGETGVITLKPWLTIYVPFTWGIAPICYDS